MVARLSANGKPIGRPPTKRPESLVQVNPAVAKKLLEVKARYDAGGRGRRMAGWTPPSTGPNRSLENLQTIRDRARDVVRNDWSGESSVQKWTTSLVGIGITPRFRRLSATRRKVVTDLWNLQMRSLDADCVLDGYGMQTLVTRAWLADGEVFARLRPRFAGESGLPLPFQVQLLEADMCPLWDTDTVVGMPEGNTIRSGIERNKRGKRVAYWFYKEHPGDRFMGSSSIDIGQLVRVAASQVAHVFEPKRVGQLRGVSALAPILARLRGINDYEDATLERQKIANLFVAFIKRTLPALDPNLIDTGALTGLEVAEIDGEMPQSALIPMGPGVMQELDDGQSVDFSNPPEAGTSYSDYMRTSHMGTAAAAGLPYEFYSGDIANVSDRTLRVLVNEFRRFAEQRQWQIIIPMYCQRVVDWFADAAALSNLVSEAEYADVKLVEHAPHGWQYIHPVQDVQGKALEVSNGFRSRASVVGERGDDIERVDEERKEDQDRAEKLGLVPAAVPAPAAPAVDPSHPQPKPQALLDALAESRRERAQLAREQTAATAALSAQILQLLDEEDGGE